jgi:hypothetical protein
MGTDGLFDNVFVEELAAVLERELGDLFDQGCDFLCPQDNDTVQPEEQEDHSNMMEEEEVLISSQTSTTVNNKARSSSDRELMEEIQRRVQRAAEEMVREAARLARSERISPFGKAAMEHGWIEYTGGKVDDITVVTALVVGNQIIDQEEEDV